MVNRISKEYLLKKNRCHVRVGLVQILNLSSHSISQVFDLVLLRLARALELSLQLGLFRLNLKNFKEEKKSLFCHT